MTPDDLLRAVGAGIDDAPPPKERSHLDVGEDMPTVTLLWSLPGGWVRRYWYRNGEWVENARWRIHACG